MDLKHSLPEVCIFTFILLFLFFSFRQEEYRPIPRGQKPLIREKLIRKLVFHSKSCLDNVDVDSCEWVVPFVRSLSAKETALFTRLADSSTAR